MKNKKFSKTERKKNIFCVLLRAVRSMWPIFSSPQKNITLINIYDGSVELA